MTTLLRSRRSRFAAVAVAAAVAAPLAFAAPASAGNLNPNPVSGAVTCNTATGLHEITWTLVNNTGEIVSIDFTNLSGAATGNPVFTPNPVPVGENATSSGTLPGSTVGAVTLNVTTSWVDGEFPMEASSAGTINLTACVIATTTTTSTSTTTTSTSTTTTTAPTTTTTKPAVVAVVATPKFTG